MFFKSEEKVFNTGQAHMFVKEETMKFSFPPL